MTSTRDHRRKKSDAAGPGSSASAGVPRRLVFIAAAGCIAVAAALSACTGGQQPGPSASRADPGASSPAGAAAQTAPAPAAGAAQGTSTAAAEDPATAALKQTLTDALNRLAAGTPKPATAQVAEALTGAGIPATALEVSESSTPTGLEADAVEAAVLQGGDCVVGQIRDGGVTVTVLPVLSSGKCFVGAAA
ncbi:DUF6993 domain-containing protein [Arthrobacter pascens]|uniref:DUF6993 domain-containing protein n=1 Tax=Arthrobacter pascens TaxID=1677 RepID=UPI0027D7F68D|nr:hypothetical protein [Arthrobacter pascens]